MDMKKIIITSLALTLCLASFAAKENEDINVRDLKVSRKGTNLEISFQADISKEATRSDYTLTVTPVLYDQSNNLQLTSIVVEGRRATISNKRHEMTGGIEPRPADAVIVPNGKNIAYVASVPYQEWMNGAAIRLDKYSKGCCTVQKLQPITLAQGVQVAPLPVAPPVVIEKQPTYIAPAPLPGLAPRYSPVVAATGMANVFGDRFPFLEYSDTPIKWCEPGKEAKDNALIVYFRQNVKVIDHDFRNNNRTLDEFMAAIRAVENSGNSRVVGVMITSFASPEGTYEYNEKLSMDRGLALKKFVMQNTPIDPSQIHIYAGGEDWEGLKDMVKASSMPYRNEVLNIIDNTPIWDRRTAEGREARLIQLRGGEPYRYMYKNMFPDLRYATYIKVFFESHVPIDNNAKIINDAQKLVARGDYNGALNMLVPINDDVRAYNTIGVTYMMMGEYKSAKEFFLMAISNGSADAQYNYDQVVARENAVRSAN